MGVGIPNFRDIFKKSRGLDSYLYQLSDDDFETSYNTFTESVMGDNHLGNIEDYYGLANTEAETTVGGYNTGNTGSGWDANSWSDYANSANNTGDGGQFNTGGGWNQTDWNEFADVRGDNYIQGDYGQGYQGVLDATGQALTSAWDIYNQGAGGTDLTTLEEAARNAATAEGTAFEGITNQQGFNTPTDLTSDIDTAYDTLAASAETQLGGLETKDFTPEIRELIESGRLDLRNLNAEQLGVLNDAFTRRTGQIGDIQGQLEGQLQGQEGFRRGIQEQIADTTATRAGQMTADQQARVEEARGALGGQVTSSFEDAAMLAGGLTGSQAMSSTAGMDRLAQVANQGAAARLAAPALLAAEAQLAVGDEKFRLENQLSLALTESLAELGAQERAQVLQEAMRQEEFGVARDQALANALVNIAGQRTGATLNEQGRLEDISQRQGEITQAQGFATAQQQETQRYQSEQQRLAMEFQNANNEIDRQMARDQMAQNERQFNMKVAQDEAARKIDTAAYEADLNLRTDAAKEAAYQANQAYELELAAQGAGEDAEIAAAEAAQATLAQNRETTHGLAVSVLGLDIELKDFMTMDQKQVDLINKQIVDEIVRSNKANKHVVGSKGWFEGQGLPPRVSSDAVAFTAWSDRIGVLEAKTTGAYQTQNAAAGGTEFTLTPAETAEMESLKKARNEFLSDNSTSKYVGGKTVVEPTEHLNAVKSAYLMMGATRDEEIGWTGGRSAEDVVGGDMTTASWGATYTNTWEDALAGAGADINQQDFVEPVSSYVGPPR